MGDGIFEMFVFAMLFSIHADVQKLNGERGAYVVMKGLGVVMFVMTLLAVAMKGF